MLGRVGGRNFLDARPRLPSAPLYEEIRTLALERYGDEVDEYLAFNARVRSHLLRAGDYEGLEALARFEAGLETEASVLEIEPEEDEAVNMTLEARIPGLRFEQDGERVRWVPPADLQGHLEPGGARGRRSTAATPTCSSGPRATAPSTCCARRPRRGSRTARRC